MKEILKVRFYSRV